eukprot:4959822-Karenia_brevis.AAC.1
MLSMGCPRGHSGAYMEMSCQWYGLCEHRHSIQRCHDQGFHEFEKRISNSSGLVNQYYLGN